MDPMNIFIGSSKAEFRDFIDQICSVPLKAPTKAVSPSYATPIQILGRLPATSREGFPSLPYLIDSAQRFANLVSLWLDHFPANHFENKDVEQPLRDFHDACVEIQQRTNDAVQLASGQYGSDRRFNQNNDMTLRDDVIDPTPTRLSRPSTRITSGTNGLRPNHTRNGSFLDSPTPLDRQEVDPADDEKALSPTSTTFDQSRLPLSRLTMNETQGSSNSKSSSTISFRRPSILRDRPSHGSQDTS
jgi:hypothetical protein